MNHHPVSDLHNDLLMLVARRAATAWASYFRDHWLPQLRAGRVSLQVLPIFVDREFRPEGALRESLRMVEAAHVIAHATSDDVALCTTGEEIAQAVAQNKIALVLALEGCPQIDDDLELFSTFHRLGVRMVSFTHFGRSSLADGSGEDATGSRLTRAGVQAVAHLEDLGVLIDVSHLGRRGTDHVLELAQRPVVASHSAARAVYDHHRNLSDDHLHAIAATDGLIGINFFAGYLSPAPATMEDLLDHIEHVVSVAGLEHVAIGADFITEVLSEKVPPCDRPIFIEGVRSDDAIPGLEGPADFPRIAEALSARGWNDRDVAAFMGGNARRFLAAMV